MNNKTKLFIKNNQLNKCLLESYKELFYYNVENRSIIYKEKNNILNIFDLTENNKIFYIINKKNIKIIQSTKDTESTYGEMIIKFNDNSELKIRIQNNDYLNDMFNLVFNFLHKSEKYI